MTYDPCRKLSYGSPKKGKHRNPCINSTQKQVLHRSLGFRQLGVLLEKLGRLKPRARQTWVLARGCECESVCVCPLLCWVVLCAGRCVGLGWVLLLCCVGLGCVVFCCVVLWCGGVAWCGVVWRGVVLVCVCVVCVCVSCVCGVVWCGVAWCGVVWCGVVWCGVMWCGCVCVWCVWCVWCVLWAVWVVGVGVCVCGGVWVCVCGCVGVGVCGCVWVCVGV